MGRTNRKRDLLRAYTKMEINLNQPLMNCISRGDITWEYTNFMPSQEIIRDVARDMCDDIVDYGIRFKISKSIYPTLIRGIYLLKIWPILANPSKYPF